MQPSLPPAKKPFFTWGRLLDALAVLVILFVVYRLVIAPRTLQSAPAQPAPHIVLPSLDGRRFELAKHHGRVVFLDFWASWCEPCKLSMPMVESFARKHPEVDVIPVDVGEPRAIVSDYAKANDVRNVALDNDRVVYNWFGVEGFPTMVVIDPKGYVRATWPGFNPAIALNMANAETQLARGETPR